MPLSKVWGIFFIGKTLFSVLIEWGILTFFHNMFQNATFGQIKKVWGGASSYIFSISYIGLFVNVSCKFWSLIFLGGPQRPLEKGIFGLKIDQFLTFGSKKHNIWPYISKNDILFYDLAYMR